MGSLRAVMFGTPAIYWNDNKVVFPFAKMEAVLYYLLIEGECTRDKLALLLWGEKADQDAKKNLRNTIYSIKKIISPELFIIPTRKMISLNRKLIYDTDAGLLNKPDIQDFLQRKSGDFLENFYCKDAELFDDWVIAKRLEFKETIIARLTSCIIIFMHKKQYIDAKQYIKQLIKIDEYNEGAYRLLMKIYEREEAFYNVIEIYHELEKKWADELNLRPSSKTEEIYIRVKEKRIAKTGVPTKKCFLGREKELQHLQHQVDKFYSQKHDRHMILVQGEQGVGKTAIVEQLFENISIKAHDVLKTSCYQAELSCAYKSWSKIIAQAMDMLKQNQIVIPSHWYWVIAYMFPAVEMNKEIYTHEPFLTTFEYNQTMVEEIICGILGRLSSQKQIIIFIDDIHWMDKKSFSVLHQLLRIYGAKILCIATCSSEYLNQIESFLWSFERDKLLEIIRVECLSFQDVGNIMSAKLSSGNRDSELQRKLYDYTGGNALILLECLNLIESKSELWSEIALQRLQSVLKGRIGNLSANARRILEVASIFLQCFTYNELLAVSKMDEFELVEAMEELEQKKLIIKAGSCQQQEIAYTFYNMQIQNFIYQQMSISKQRLLHNKVGLEVEQKFQKGLQIRELYESILYHYNCANNKVKILEYTIKYVQKYFCFRYEMFPELTGYYTDDFCEERSQTVALSYLKKIADLLNTVALENFDQEQIVVYKAAYWEMMGRYYIWRGEHLVGIKSIHQLLLFASAKGLQEYLCKGYEQMVFFGIQTGRPSIIKKFAKKLLDIAEQNKSKEKMAVAWRFVGVAFALSNESKLAEQYYQQSIRMFKKLIINNDQYVLQLAAAYSYIGNLRRDVFKWKEALHYYDKAVKITGHKQLSEGVAVLYIDAGYAAFKLGDYDKACHYMSEALTVGDSFGEKGYWCLRSFCTLYCVLANIEVSANRHREGCKYLHKAEECLNQCQDNHQRWLVLITKMKIRQAMDKNHAVADIFGNYLTLSVQEYYQQAKAAFGKASKIQEEVLRSVKPIITQVELSKNDYTELARVQC
ncbi:AAA family ATPase [Sporomusa acidovorans]|uniref:Bacterial transcriptional activator domain protein n=1 Tax=Sporomusa acidovorans (strain ATCC 49682 / DSM 3132 / Mol) TaxID=1123286 RepID=A0ABZ3JA42_SPOA4|nr:AAA family ATPase [Sporomusa acidovorans]OZC21616.1 bacterial transcriptional activator domain protein [Sporomusa acidovorans DSM 3132]SDD62752.1 DNA-binding transcriptional activator of the SARP family [Sporomusa acidovorans]